MWFWNTLHVRWNFWHIGYLWSHRFPHSTYVSHRTDSSSKAWIAAAQATSGAFDALQCCVCRMSKMTSDQVMPRRNNCSEKMQKWFDAEQAHWKATGNVYGWIGSYWLMTVMIFFLSLIFYNDSPDSLQVEATKLAEMEARQQKPCTVDGWCSMWATRLQVETSRRST